MMGCACGKSPLSAGKGMTGSCLCGVGAFATVTPSGGVVGTLECVADAVRDLETKLGARAYEVKLIWTKWTGGIRNRGEEYVWKEELLSPTPSVEAISDLQSEVKQHGAIETGFLRVTEISPRYGEDFLLGYLNGAPPDPDVNFYWEISTVTAAEKKAIARRFVPSGPPNKVPTEFAWTMKLARVQVDRVPSPMPRTAGTGLQ